MRLKIKGNVGKQEMLESFAQLINSLEDAGVNEFKGVNLYFTPYVSGERVQPLFNGIEAGLQCDSEKKHRTTEKDEDGKSVVHYQTGVRGSDINLDGRIPYNPKIKLITEKMLEEEKLKEWERNREERESRMAAIYKKEEERQAIAKEEKEKGVICLAFIREKLGMSEEEFRNSMGSSNWIRTQRGIEKYTSDKVVNKAFRISMKIEGSNEKKVYLFSENAELLFES